MPVVLPTRAETDALHALYVQLTGYDLRLTPHRISVWTDWFAQGFRADDLRLVIRYLKLQIRLSKRNQGALRFNNLIGMHDLFEEDRELAREDKRLRSPDKERGRPGPASDSDHPSEPAPDKALLDAQLADMRRSLRTGGSSASANPQSAIQNPQSE
jgi:hypothetical protein